MRHVGECRHCGQALPHPAELCSECNRLWCGHCGCVTNHTTAQHEDAMVPLCADCGEPIKNNDDPEARYCAPCWQEEQEWRAQCAYDAKGKEINRDA